MCSLYVVCCEEYCSHKKDVLADVAGHCVIYTWHFNKSEQDRKKWEGECREGCLDTDSGNEEKGGSSGQSEAILHDSLRAPCQ